ncbi:MAG: hypothetical protein K2G83_06325 [Ruminococcus sp.]|nr:hypothetical protein [Ruminococcus sp.]
MRKESEKKTKVTSLRMTEEQYHTIQEMADEKDMPMGSYIVDSAIHSQKSVTPDILVKIQNLVNTACAVIEESALDKAEKMETEAKKLWSLLK